ncbi:uncharacterized protein K452DRAFT_91671 [Aplosporella prunicola CBS 121167]|uniref:Uncharacterized protein n=1 Tax=Aplosporella prunicola CBS 121167 TaxID=1176127 RepID=A0A6A6B4I5_9PEZI|nr:uncharacterized protein K452DRAFT_91671 [Aplosporella prunicola CBS 121167]KAF2138303.1 hypothetical protein K452DRAFT_91671 [Aplosporella prunicola CBS 121167]
MIIIKDGVRLQARLARHGTATLDGKGSARAIVSFISFCFEPARGPSNDARGQILVEDLAGDPQGQKQDMPRLPGDNQEEESQDLAAGAAPWDFGSSIKPKRARHAATMMKECMAGESTVGPSSELLPATRAGSVIVLSARMAGVGGILGLRD